jgi:hypothetical protein
MSFGPFKKDIRPLTKGGAVHVHHGKHVSSRPMHSGPPQNAFPKPAAAPVAPAPLPPPQGAPPPPLGNPPAPMPMAMNPAQDDSGGSQTGGI